MYINKQINNDRIKNKQTKNKFYAYPMTLKNIFITSYNINISFHNIME